MRALLARHRSHAPFLELWAEAAEVGERVTCYSVVTFKILLLRAPDASETRLSIGRNSTASGSCCNWRVERPSVTAENYIFASIGDVYGCRVQGCRCSRKRIKHVLDGSYGGLGVLAKRNETQTGARPGFSCLSRSFDDRQAGNQESDGDRQLFEECLEECS